LLAHEAVARHATVSNDVTNFWPPRHRAEPAHAITRMSLPTPGRIQGSRLYESTRVTAVSERGVSHTTPGARYGTRMTGFEGPVDLTFNRGPIADPEAFARDAGAASWLYLCGEEFAAMDGGMSYSQVQAAVPESENVISDPPRVLDMDMARRHMAALDRLPRPTLVTCRAGPRSSAVAYLYAGLRAGASADEVLACADADQAPFAGSEELRAFVTQGLAELAP